MRPSFSFGPIGDWLSKEGGATLAIVALLGLGAILSLLVPPFAPAVAHLPGRWTTPWTFLTYPLAVEVAGGLFGPFFTVLLLFLVYSLGTQVERELGQGRYLAFWGVATLLPALLLSIPGFAVPLFGPTLPVAALIVVWAVRNAGAQVLAMALFPLQAKWFAAIAAAGVFAQYYRISVPASLMALVPLGIAWAWAADRIPPLPYRARFRPSKAEQKREIDFQKAVRERRDERAEKERLRRLLEGPPSDRDGR